MERGAVPVLELLDLWCPFDPDAEVELRPGAVGGERQRTQALRKSKTGPIAA
jgi:hypothetical protein